MNKAFACRIVFLLLMGTSKAWASIPVQLPGLTLLQGFMVIMTSVYAPIVMAAVLLGFLFALARFSDREDWLGGFIRWGLVASLAGQAITLATFFTGAPAEGALPMGN